MLYSQPYTTVSGEIISGIFTSGAIPSRFFLEERPHFAALARTE
jgi:hypothetical protein